MNRDSVEWRAENLTQAKVDNLLPGWAKAPGQPARATFTLAPVVLSGWAPGLRACRRGRWVDA